MKTIQLKDEIFDWKGTREILYTPFYKVSPTEPIRIIEIITDKTKGIVILGSIEAVVDALIYTESGAVGNTTTFSGTNLAILGLPISELEDSLAKSDLNEKEAQKLKSQAEAMISKFKGCIEDTDSRMNISFGEMDDEHEHIIFGRKNFLLIGSKEKFVLIHKKQISVREGENKLVQIDPVEGIIIAERDKVLNFGGTSRNNLGSLLGEFGVTIASSVLNQILWD
ncbi:MAG: hypothetical protein ACXADY_09040 [Candidatus Hodarchaeales archaeon]